mmetsp:Transcript_41411/g.30442  ORF Transcript_41411/g.30442 Transcript_41411/m.30442 type:complete len:83 (-) Transcript_41411:317-565(-)|eukprot:CAMPEP_0202971858 /NCGR_PEP_ID=MMETSP1396-20130829/31656_1 /ASSEMBLY_ACC=CAM_ASM_000872 /TAXON_ID= /ORGANISM="Pseudokeronopsis sp., Strain Brazil" /LENGTH=82 /DNA_ID=CAMNT_0049701697 /DNA_START=999 /DNA_END=1247 /DNA_ORIENTATION=-
MTDLKEKLKKLEGIEILDVKGHFEEDLTKICLKVQGLSGTYVRNYLRSKYKIDPEVMNAKCILMSYHVGTSSEVLDDIYTGC